MHKRRTSRWSLPGPAGVVSAMLAIVAIVAVGPLAAEIRFYESRQARGPTMEAFVDELTRSGIRFVVRKVFNEEKDRRVGFVFLLAPKRTYCEVTFHERPRGRGSLVRIMTQSTEEANQFEILLTRHLKFRAIGEDPARHGDTTGFPRRRR